MYVDANRMHMVSDILSVTGRVRTYSS